MDRSLSPLPATPHPSAARPLPFETLDAFRVAVELVELVAALSLPRGCGDAADQTRRAAASVALNIAEGCGKDGRDRVRYYAIARGSALESAAALRVLLAFGAVSRDEHACGRALCARLYAMLTAMMRGRG